MLNLQIMRKLFAYSLVLLSLCSCKVISNLVDDDQVVAKVGDVKLYRSQVEQYIPDLVSPEDSLNLAMQFINSGLRKSSICRRRRRNFQRPRWMSLRNLRSTASRF